MNNIITTRKSAVRSKTSDALMKRAHQLLSRISTDNTITRAEQAECLYELRRLIDAELDKRKDEVMSADPAELESMGEY